MSSIVILKCHKCNHEQQEWKERQLAICMNCKALLTKKKNKVMNIDV